MQAFGSGMFLGQPLGGGSQSQLALMLVPTVPFEYHTTFPFTES